MDNKTIISRLKDNADLAWASYGYFDLVGNKFDKETTQKLKIDKDHIITQKDILDITYKNCVAIKKDVFGKPEKIGTLKGDFTPTQAKQFFERYTLLKHCPNTASGFSATLFQHKKSKELTLAIRGTEFSLNRIEDLITDYYIGTNNNDTNMVIEQYFDMLIFYEERIKAILKEKGANKINVVGHSLGGFLAQLFAISYPKAINEIYTYNAPGVRADKITKTLYWVAQGIGAFMVFKGVKYAYKVGKGALSMVGFFWTNNKPLNQKDIFLQSENKEKVVGIIPIKSSNKLNIKFNNLNGDDSAHQRIISSEFTNNIPYFLRDDGNKFARDNNLPIFYYKNMGKYAREFYDLITYSGYDGKYLYYRYNLNSINTQAQISKFEYKIFDYDLNIPFESMIDTLTNKNEQIILNTNNIFHIISLNNANKRDIIGYLGNNIIGQDLPINVGTANIFDAHSILALTQTLYFYSYLLESNSNEIKDKNLTQTIEYLNKFNQDIKTHTETFILNRINKTNQRAYNIHTMLSSPIFIVAIINRLFGNATPKTIDYLSFFFSIINAKIHKIEALKQGKSNYIESIITKDKIIDLIISLSKDKYYIKILSQAFFEKTRKQCDYINDKSNIAYKICIGQYQNFILIDKNDNPLETQENIGSIYGYNSNAYLSLNQIWEEQCLGGKCKIIQGLYFGGKNQVFIAS